FFSSRRRHTRSKRDWSSDCALPISRLVHAHVTGEEGILPIYGHREDLDEFEKLSHDFTEGVAYDPEKALQIGPFTITFLKTVHKIGRASCRERVWMSTVVESLTEKE